MPMLYRVWAKVRRTAITKWERHHAGPWDGAVRSSSALRAAINSQLLDDVGRYNQATNGTILFDFGEFDDNVNIMRLIMLGLQHGYPRRIRSLGLHMHMACRGLKCNDTHPGFSMPTNGIVAGCTPETTFTKALLMDIMQTMYVQ